MEMKFFERSVQNKSNTFTDALLQYQSDLEEGNYGTVSDYTQESLSWTTQDELDFLETILKPLVLKLTIPGITLANLREKLEAEGSVGLPKNVNLLTAISLLRNKESGVISLERLAEIHEMQIEAVIPSASLVSLVTLRNVTVDKRVKFTALSNIIDSTNVEVFGAFGKLVCRIAIHDWLQVYPTLHLRVQESFAADKATYVGLQVDYSKDVEDTASMTLVEQYTMLCLENVANELIQIHQDAPESGDSTSPRLTN